MSRTALALAALLLLPSATWAKVPPATGKHCRLDNRASLTKGSDEADPWQGVDQSIPARIDYLVVDGHTTYGPRLAARMTALDSKGGPTDCSFLAVLPANDDPAVRSAMFLMIQSAFDHQEWVSISQTVPSSTVESRGAITEVKIGQVATGHPLKKTRPSK